MLEQLQEGYRRCDQCGSPIAPGEEQMRTKTHTLITGVAARHRTVTLTLCQKCARHYDQTGSHFFTAAFLFVVGLALLGFGGCLFSR